MKYRIRHILPDTLGVAALVILTISPLGLFTDDSGWGWYWPNLGGYYFDTDTLDLY